MSWETVFLVLGVVIVWNFLRGLFEGLVESERRRRGEVSGDVIPPAPSISERSREATDLRIRGDGK